MVSGLRAQVKESVEPARKVLPPSTVLESSELFVDTTQRSLLTQSKENLMTSGLHKHMATMHSALKAYVGSKIAGLAEVEKSCNDVRKLVCIEWAVVQIVELKATDPDGMAEFVDMVQTQMKKKKRAGKLFQVPRVLQETSHRIREAALNLSQIMAEKAETAADGEDKGRDSILELLLPIHTLSKLSCAMCGVLFNDFNVLWVSGRRPEVRAVGVRGSRASAGSTFCDWLGRSIVPAAAMRLSEGKY